MHIIFFSGGGKPELYLCHWVICFTVILLIVSREWATHNSRRAIYQFQLFKYCKIFILFPYFEGDREGIHERLDKKLTEWSKFYWESIENAESHFSFCLFVNTGCLFCLFCESETRVYVKGLLKEKKQILYLSVCNEDITFSTRLLKYNACFSAQDH